MKAPPSWLGLTMLKRWIFLPFMAISILVMLISQDRNMRLVACLVLLALVQAREVLLMQELDYHLQNALAVQHAEALKLQTEKIDANAPAPSADKAALAEQAEADEKKKRPPPPQI